MNPYARVFLFLAVLLAAAVAGSDAGALKWPPPEEQR